jgi:hypothetical protein
MFPRMDLMGALEIFDFWLGKPGKVELIGQHTRSGGRAAMR